MLVLKPKVILRHVQEGEEILWMKSDLTVVDGAPNNDPATTLVRRGQLVRQIHQYFGGLEPRKCCLALSGCKTSFSNVRLVRNDGRDSGIEEGAMIRSPADAMETIKDLTVQEERVFRRSYLCASYPVLCAPEPPSPLSPPPVVPQGSKKFQFKGQLTITRPPTPDDSGLEEDMSVVPADTLFELLRRTFHLSQENFSKYEHQIYRFHQRKEPSRILAEELVVQLALLENNVNPYYNPQSFMSSSGYDNWQRKEFSHIAELLKKFWHTAYPPLTNNYKQTQRGILEDYRTLLLKLLRYESPYRVEGELLAPGLTCLLSSASVRLLKEFGLRYGIREVYRKLVYLQYLTGNFVPSPWFIQHTCNTLLSVLDMLPNSGASHVLLKIEYDIFKESIDTLEKLGNSNICKMKSLFPNNRPSNGLDFLIYLVTLTQKGRQYLLDKKSHSVDAILKDCVQSIFPVCYEEYKIVAMKDLHQKVAGLSPTLMNKMICKIRDEVKDYKAYYQATFEKYFNVTLMAAQKLYSLLMEDIAKVCQNQPRNANIDKCMLGLAYRLNQLDQAWVTYISEEQQTWRTWFQAEQVHWTKVLTVQMIKFVQETISKDKFEGAVVQDIHSIIDTPASSLAGHRIRSLSSKSITPSINSAFSGMMSSLHSTPMYSRFTPLQRQDSKQSRENTPVKQSKDPSGKSGSWFNKLHISVSAPGPFRDTQSLCDFSEEEEEEEGVMTFSNLRHSSSVPEMLSKSYDHHLDVTRPSLKFPVSTSHEKDVSSVEEARESSPSQIPHENKPPAKTENGGINNLSSCPESKDADEVNTIDKSDFSHETNQKSDTNINQEGRESSQQEGETTDIEGEVTPTQADSHQQLLNQNAMKVGQIPLGDRTDGDQDSLAGEFTQSVEEEDREGDRESLSSTQDSPVPNFDFPPVSEVVTLACEKLTEDDQIDNPVMSTSNSNEQQQNGASSSAKDSKEPLSSSEVETSSPEFQTSSSDIPSSVSSVKSAYIPVSGSLFDVLVLLQRIVGFGKTLCETFYKSMSSHRINELESSFSSSTTASSYCGGDLRKKLYTQFHEVVCSTLTVYADNILCLDLCGTTHSEGIRLVGAKMVEHLQNCKRSDKIWGCRHQTLGIDNCFQYVNRQTDMLYDRYEPVSQAMCIRMNIVSSLMSYCEVFYKKLASVFHYEWSHVSPTEFYGLSEDGGLNSMDACKSHIQTVVRSMARLMAYRLNLFVYDAMMIYLTLRDTRRSVAASLSPLTQFLGSYIDLLNQWLYLDNFHIVLENLWVFIVQNFEKETVNLVHSQNSLEAAEQLVQAFTILLKLMSNKGAGIHRNLMLSQAESVMLKLQIYTTASNQLIQLYEKLTEHYYGSDTVSICTLDGTVKTILHRIREDLLIYRKCFSGAHLVSWIMRHPELFYQFDPDLESSDNSKEKRWKAISIAESLLKGGIIVDLDAEDDTDSEEEDDGVDFPELSLAGGNGSSFLCDGNISSTNTPRATPVPPTEERPQSALKKSLHQSLHSHYRGTPVLLRSQKSYDSHPSHVMHQTSVHLNPAAHSVEPSQQPSTIRPSIHQNVRTPTPLKLNPQSLKAQRSFRLCQTRKDEQSNLKTKDEGPSNSQREVASEVGDNNDDNETPSGETMTSDNPVWRPVIHSELDYQDIGGWHLPHRTTPNLNESLLNNSFQDGEFLFEDSRRKYYRIASFADSLIPSRAPGSEELNSIMEKCIEMKIIPDFVFRILMSRKYFDHVAQLYVEKHASGENDLSCEVS